MADRQYYLASDDSWATASEVVINDPVAGGGFNLPLRVEPHVQVEFAVFAISTSTGKWAPFVDAALTILDENLNTLPLSAESPTAFLSPDSRVAILIKPPSRSWYASISEGTVPFAVATCAFHQAAAPDSQTFSTIPRTRCRLCKMTAKALALAIVASVGAAALPAALLSAVAAYLGGIGTVAAAAFINSVIGDAVDEVAEKLCIAVSLCP